MAADVCTGLITEEEFRRKYLDHKANISQVAWAFEDAKRRLETDEDGEPATVRIMTPSKSKRMQSLYVEIESDNVIAPEKTISQDEAKSMIHTLSIGLDRVIEMTEH